MKACPDYTEFLREALTMGYEVFREQAGKQLNLNLVGWRNSESRPNHFDDFVTLYWEHRGEWLSRYWPASTLPGTNYLLNPLSPAGTAVLMPGQYRGAYSLGPYKGYEALLQVKPVKVFRDNNRDAVANENVATVESGMFGIHIHRAGLFSKLVGLASAGCQVFQNRTDFESLIRICSMASNWWGNSFTYTLLSF